MENSVIDVHNIVPEPPPRVLTREQIVQGLQAVISKAEIRADGSSTYTLQNVDERLRYLNRRLQEQPPPSEHTPVEIEEMQREIAYLVQLRIRDFPDAPAL